MPESLPITIRVTDLEPVKKILTSAGDLADAVENYLGPYRTRDELTYEQGSLAEALRLFRATVRAQTDD